MLMWLVIMLVNVSLATTSPKGYWRCARFSRRRASIFASWASLLTPAAARRCRGNRA